MPPRLRLPVVLDDGSDFDATAIGNDRHAAALRDAAFEAAYLIIACRALGLDCGPVWEFDKALVDAAFFPEGTVASHFLCALGYGDESQLSPDDGQPGAAEACRIL